MARQWRVRCPEGPGRWYSEKEVAITEAVAMLETDRYAAGDVVVEWQIASRSTMAPRATFLARQRARKAREHEEQVPSPAVPRRGRASH